MERRPYSLLHLFRLPRVESVVIAKILFQCMFDPEAFDMRIREGVVILIDRRSLHGLKTARQTNGSSRIVGDCTFNHDAGACGKELACGETASGFYPRATKGTVLFTRTGQRVSRINRHGMSYCSSCRPHLVSKGWSVTRPTPEQVVCGSCPQDSYCRNSPLRQGDTKAMLMILAELSTGYLSTANC